MIKNVSVFVIAALGATGCGEYFGIRDFGLGGGTGNTAALNDGAGDCEGIENCINVDITDTVVLTRGEWTLGRKNNDASNYVKVRNGASLFIEPGTIIRGLNDTALIVARGSQLYAMGEPEAPIVFTSAQPVGSRTSGSWGGVLMLGNAVTNNDPGTVFEALPAADADGAFGGDDDNDSSGVLRYTRIEFAGFSYLPDREFNGLTLAGAGRGTVIDHVQIHRSSDDGIEFFGGTVDVKFLVSSQNEDDGFDTDNGYRGRTQFLVIQHINPRSADPNGFESDNAPSSDRYNDTPRTHPVVWNATLIGTDNTQVNPSNQTPYNSFGAILRRGTSGSYGNQIITAFRNMAIDVRDAETAAQFPVELNVTSSLFFSNAGDANFVNDSNDNGFDEGASFLDPSTNNVAQDPRLRDMLSTTRPNFLPTAVIPGAAPPADDFFDANATYMGAMSTFDWSAGWTSYPEN